MSQTMRCNRERTVLVNCYTPPITCCCRRSCCSPFREVWNDGDGLWRTLLPADRVAAILSPRLCESVRGKRFKASRKREMQPAIALLLLGRVSFTIYLNGNKGECSSITIFSRFRIHDGMQG